MRKLFLILMAASGALCASEYTESGAEIVRLLEAWPEAFNTGNNTALCGLFAPDVVASYPGTPDRNYEQICRQLTDAAAARKFRYDKPEIKQVIVEGDLAAVRLVWTLHGEGITTREYGLDVFKKQPDGTWKIAISYAYPISD